MATRKKKSRKKTAAKQVVEAKGKAVTKKVATKEKASVKKKAEASKTAVTKKKATSRKKAAAKQNAVTPTRKKKFVSVQDNGKQSVTSAERHQMICERAYLISLSRDPYTGDPDDDWVAAEIIIDEICEVCD